VFPHKILAQSYHERESQVIRLKNVNLSSGLSFLTVFFPFIDTLLKLQQQILICFCKFSFNSVVIVSLLLLLT